MVPTSMSELPCRSTSICSTSSWRYCAFSATGAAKAKVKREPHGTWCRSQSALLFVYPINLTRHVEIILRDPARGVSTQGTRHPGVPDVDVGVMVGRLRGLGHCCHEVDSSQKIAKLESLRN